MVEIFKTQITGESAADAVIQQLQKHFPLAKINVDLEDCDRVLRVEAEGFSTDEIIRLTQKLGYSCELLL